VSNWRYHAMNVLTREWLHRDLPLRDVTITPTLSGPQALTATIAPDVAALKTDSGRPLLDEWSTFIVAEADDQIRGGGILTSSTFTGSVWALTITGFTGYAKGQPMTSTLSYGGDNASGRDLAGPTSGKGADPIRIVQDLWAQLQSHPDGDLGVTFAGDITSRYRYANWRNIPNFFTYAPDASTSVTVNPPSSATADSHGNYPAKTMMSVVVAGTGFTKRTKPNLPNFLTTKIRYWYHNVYWYENTDIGARIDQYATSTPFDYVERIRWADADKSDIRLEIVVGYPRLGRRLADLRFAEGENVTQIIAVKRDGEDYANTVTAIGAGDGKDQLRQTVGKRDGRLRRVLVQTNTSLTDRTRLRSYATASLNTVNQVHDIDALTVRQHPNAEYGSYEVGDDIPVVTWRGWEQINLWVRITSMAYSPDSDTVVLTTKRSDSFRYGGISA
jgi:hypothetical protein